MLEFEHESINH